LVVHRLELLARDPGDRVEAAAGATGQDDALHVRSFRGSHQSWRDRYQAMVSSSRSSKFWAGAQPSERSLEESTAYLKSCPGRSGTRSIHVSSRPKWARILRVSSMLASWLSAPMLYTSPGVPFSSSSRIAAQWSDTCNQSRSLRPSP